MHEGIEFGVVNENPTDCKFYVAVSEDDIASSHYDMDAIVYIARYAALAVSKKPSCSACSGTLVITNREVHAENSSMLAIVSRGGLKFLQPCVINMALVTNIFVQKLSLKE